jgi:ribosomal protein S12 methylthiotransferase accessory factor
LPPEGLESLVSPYVGIVRGVQEVPAGTQDIRLHTMWCETAHMLTLVDSTVAHGGGGSGPSPGAARAAAIGEAVERYSASFADPDELVVATARELGSRAVDPARFALYSERQYRTPGFPYVPFDRDTRLAWIDGFALPDGEQALLPAQLVHLVTTRDEPRICRATSSGLACHGRAAEATLSALLELLERDAFMLTWKASLGWPLLDWSSNEQLVEWARLFLRPTGLRAHAVDMSAVWDVPCCAAIARSSVPGTAPLGVGAAAGVTVERAVTKALDEATRVRTWAQALRGFDPDGTSTPPPDAIRGFDDHICFYADPRNAHRVAFLDASAARRDVGSIPPLTGETPEERIDAICKRLRRRFASAYAVDVTAPDVRDAGLTVMRVVAPELCALDVEHEARLLGGRRLYEEPARLGFSRRSLAEDDLNPDPHPFP